MIRHLAVLGLVVMVFQTAAADDLQIFDDDKGGQSEMMTKYLNDLSRDALARRREVYEAVETVQDCEAYQKRLRDFFVERLGGWPERTPLNPRTVAEQRFADYRIEKVIYESRPGFYVTAILHLPLTDPPYPGVLVPCGHSSNGKACEAYQRACINLAKNGIAAFIYDPIGQGERFQIVDDEGKGIMGGTLEHTLTGVGAILVGMNTATFRIWDGIRGIDYLCQRDDIDPDRIGCTGNSGGGTLTSYIMALDDRVKVAAPSCYLTSFERLLETIGPQDAEQDIYAQVAFGIDHADYVIMRAPKPTLMCCATHDFFDITGTWDSFRQAKRFYTRMGFSERVDIVENDAKHGFTQPLRIAMVRWMCRWLLGRDEAIGEPEFPVLSEEAALCTDGGQVLELEGARSVWDIMAEREQALARERRKLWASKPLDELSAEIRSMTGIRPLEKLPEPEVEKVGALDRGDYRVEKLVLKPEPGIVLPALVFVPEKPGGDACLYIHGQGKHVDAAPGGPIEKLVEKGRVVLAVDLRGIGETESDDEQSKSWDLYCGTDWKDFFRAYLLGKSYVGMRAEDVLVCARFLEGYRDGDESEADRGIDVTGIGEAAPAVLHAAFVEQDMFDSVRLERMVTSWADVVRTPRSRNQLVNTVHGALRVYDLPDLVNSLPDDAVSVIDPMAPDGKPA